MFLQAERLKAKEERRKFSRRKRGEDSESEVSGGFVNGILEASVFIFQGASFVDPEVSGKVTRNFGTIEKNCQ